MTPAEITRAVQTYVQANWTATPVGYDNVSFSPPKDAPYVRVSVRPGKTFEDELGQTGAAHRDGVVKVQVLTRLGVGAQDGGKLAGQVEALFRRKDVGDVYFDEPYTEELGDDQHGRYLHVVNCPFWCWV